MVERQPGRLELRGGWIIPSRCLVKPGAGCQLVQRFIARAGLAVNDQMLHRRQRFPQLRDNIDAVEVDAAIANAVAGDQHLGLDLPEAIQHRVGPHVGCADAPDATDAHHRKESDDRLRGIGQVRRHPVARLHALLAQVQRQRSDLAPQLRPVQFAVLAVLVAADQRLQAGRVRLVHMPEYLVHIVELRALEPPGSGHLAGEHRRVPRRRLQLVVVPDALPEGRKVGHRPFPERVVAVEMKTAQLAQPVLVTTDLGNKGRPIRGRHAP